MGCLSRKPPEQAIDLKIEKMEGSPGLPSIHHHK